MVAGILGIVLLLGLPAQADEVKLTAFADSAQYRIGDWILVRVEGTFPAGAEHVAPAVGERVGPFEVLRVEALEPRRTDRDVEHRWLFKLTTFDSGRVFIPPIEFSYTFAGDTVQRSAFTVPVFLTIAGVAIDPQGDIKDIKPPLDAPWLFEDYLPYLVALGLVIAGIGAYYLLRRKRRSEALGVLAHEPSIPPHVEALAALRALEDKRLWQQGRSKDYYSEVTEILRRFFERQYGILALEQTSDEILQQMKRVPEAVSVENVMRSFFTDADLVKFARYQPTPEEHERELRSAYEMVRALSIKTAPISGVQKEEAVDVG
jgi:hypothetical protein